MFGAVFIMESQVHQFSIIVPFSNYFFEATTEDLKQCKYEVVVKGVFVVLEVENLRPWDSRTRTFFKLSIRWVNSISDQKVGQYLDQRISVQWRNAVCSSSSYFCFWRWVGWHLIFVVLFNFDYNLYLILLNGKFCLF